MRSVFQLLISFLFFEFLWTKAEKLISWPNSDAQDLLKSAVLGTFLLFVLSSLKFVSPTKFCSSNFTNNTGLKFLAGSYLLLAIEKRSHILVIRFFFTSFQQTSQHSVCCWQEKWQRPNVRRTLPPLPQDHWWDEDNFHSDQFTLYTFILIGFAWDHW